MAFILRIGLSIIEHPNGSDYAILKHDSYTAELTEEETLGAEWFPQNDIE